MRYLMLLSIMLMAAAAGPAQAQGAASQGSQRVTLDLRRVRAAEAVAKLGELTGLELRCDPRLAERKVSLVAQDGAPQDVSEGLARAVRGRWRQADQARVLEPASPESILTRQEAASELRAGFLQPYAMSTYDLSQAREEGMALKDVLSPQQLQGLATGDGLGFADFTPEQQRALVGLLTFGIAGTLRRLPDMLTKAEGLGGTTISIEKRPDGEMLHINGPGGFVGSLGLGNLSAVSF